MSAVAQAIPEPIPDRSDVQKYIRFAVLDRVAHVGIMLDKMQRQIRRAEAYELMAATGNTKYLEDAVSEEKEMAVNIGNEKHIHKHIHYASPPPTTEPTATEPTPTTGEAEPAEETEPPPAPQPSIPPVQAPPTNGGPWKCIWPTIIGGALLGTGAAGTALYNYLTDKPESVTTISQPGKFEYRYGIEQRPTPNQ